MSAKPSGVLPQLYFSELCFSLVKGLNIQLDTGHIADTYISDVSHLAQSLIESTFYTFHKLQHKLFCVHIL